MIATGLFYLDEDVFATLAAYADYVTLNDQEKNNLYYLKQLLLNRLFVQNNIERLFYTKPSYVNFTVKPYTIDDKSFATLQNNLKENFNITLVRSKSK